ncbi:MULTISPECIES: phosphohydrolase [Aeromonas]|uniref:phosphohydrolase n=1 Tax=Aeromonas TaxID=642 RepID=UPI00131A4C50|nr:phosphohydrolase [Aeromonas hydrophila]HCT2506981.1 hypothetical protein [Aeromonas dhakensis]
MNNDKCRFRHLFYASGITVLLMMIGMLVFFNFISTPSLLKYLGLEQALTLTDPKVISDPMTSHMIGELVRQGTLVSLDDVWSYQSSLYQTIITFLIAINGLLAALAIFYIKSSSNDKAIEIVHEFVESKEFKEFVNKKVKQKLKVARDEYDESTQKLELMIGEGEGIREKVSVLSSEYEELNRQMTVIAKKIASMDQADMDGHDFFLSKD